MSNAISKSRSPKSQDDWICWEMKLIKLAHLKGLTDADLSTVINRTKNAIAQKAARMGYPIKRV